MASASSSWLRENCASLSLPRISAALAVGAVAEHVGDDLGRQSLLGFQLLALQAVIGGDVAHLMRDDGGKLGRIIGQRQQAAGHVEITARQREGVDVGRIEDGDAIGLRADWPDTKRQPADDLGHHALELGVGIFAAIGGEDARVLGLGQLRELVVAGDIVDGDRIFRRLERLLVERARETLAAGDGRCEHAAGHRTAQRRRA